MTRLIDAEKLKKHYAWWEDDERRALFDQIVDAQPTIDAEPVRHGKWIRQTDTRFGEMLNDILICSECNVAFSTVKMIRRSYCPNCGARMLNATALTKDANKAIDEEIERAWEYAETD